MQGEHFNYLNSFSQVESLAKTSLKSLTWLLYSSYREVPLSLCQGLLRSPNGGTYPPWLTWGTSCPVCSLQSQEWLMGSKPPSSIGTTERWRVSAFTWRNDLRQNAQTLLACQCAYRVPALGLMPYGLMAPTRTLIL